MALTRARRVLLITIALLLLASPSAIYSCGPFFEDTIFSYQQRPQPSWEDFAAGKLGIIRPGFRFSHLVVAYRYMTGLKLDAEQQRESIEVWQDNTAPAHEDENDALKAWIEARKTVSAVPSPAQISPYAPISPEDPYEQFLNCNSQAFSSAVDSLKDRSAKFGVSSDDLRTWVLTQDQVFANCDGKTKTIPSAATSGNSLLNSDHAYQIAAANFYARNFDAAIADFDDIAKDPRSPWSSIAPYLAARTLVRKSTLASSHDQEFDKATMLEAGERLQTMVNGPHTGPLKDPALKLLNFVRFRTEPAARAGELEHVLLGPGQNHNFKQDLWDYVLLVSHGEHSGEMSDWLTTFQATGSNQPAQAAQHALEEWHKTKSVPWLLAAISSTTPDSPNVPELLAAATQVETSSPAYLSLRYYALLLMIHNDPLVVRKDLDSILEYPQLPLGTRNLFNDERQKVASDFTDFIAHASEIPVATGVDMNGGENLDQSLGPNPPPSSPAYFSEYAARVIVRRTPLSLLVEGAKQSSLPHDLRRELSRTTWVRSVLLQDYAAASALEPVLQEFDPALSKSMDTFRSATTSDDKNFAAIFLILHNPGLKPSVMEGVLRRDTLGEINELHDNWWCSDVGADVGKPNYFEDYDTRDNQAFHDPEPNFPFPSFLSDKEKSQATAEWQKLAAIGTAPNYLATQVLAYAKTHPSDPRIPEALHLTVRATRLGCTNRGTSAFSKEAFQALHSQYPNSEWTAKTKYHY